MPCCGVFGFVDLKKISTNMYSFLKTPATTTAMAGTTTATAAVSVIFGFCSPGYSCMCVSVKTPYNP